MLFSHYSLSCGVTEIEVGKFLNDFLSFSK